MLKEKARGREARSPVSGRTIGNRRKVASLCEEVFSQVLADFGEPFLLQQLARLKGRRVPALEK